MTKLIISDDEYAALWQYTRNYIDAKCLIRNRKMPGKAKGSTYTWMFYLRNGLFDPEFAFAIGKMFIYKMERLDPEMNFQISGLETAATPLVLGIAMTAKYHGKDINAFIVRKDRKTYGLLNALEGIPNKKLCVLVDDLCNSGRSMARAFDVLEEEGIEVANLAFSIVNKSNSTHSVERQTTDMYLPKGMGVVSLFSLDDFGLTNPSH